MQFFHSMDKKFFVFCVDSLKKLQYQRRQQGNNAKRNTEWENAKMDKTIFVFDASTGIGPGNFDKYGHIYTSIKEVYENDLSTKYCGERYRINSQCDQNSDFWYACYLRSETDAKSSEWLQLEATYKRIKKYHSYNIGESDLMGAIFAAEKTFKPKIFRINGKDTTRDNFILWIKEQSIKILGAIRSDTK